MHVRNWWVEGGVVVLLVLLLTKRYQREGRLIRSKCSRRLVDMIEEEITRNQLVGFDGPGEATRTRGEAGNGGATRA